MGAVLPPVQAWVDGIQIWPHFELAWNASPELERRRFLRFVRVCRAFIDLQLSKLRSPDAVLGQHPANCRFDEPLGVLAPYLFDARLSDTARVARMPVVNLALLFVACQNNFIGINNDDVIPGVEKRSIARLVLAGQDLCDPACETTQHLAFRVHDVPCTVNVSLFQKGRRHESPSTKIIEKNLGDGNRPNE